MMTVLLACAQCFGDPGSDQVKAAKIGVLVMLGFIVPVLGGIGFVARVWAKRARALEQAGQL
jgi:hypothetical protein